MNDENALETKLRYLDKKYPLIIHTGAGQLYSTVRRMRAEKELGIPINRRTGFAISAKTGKPGNEMDQSAWDEFYSALSARLKRDHPDLYRQVFDEPGAQS